jgi:hypothetical protein
MLQRPTSFTTSCTRTFVKVSTPMVYSQSCSAPPRAACPAPPAGVRLATLSTSTSSSAGCEYRGDILYIDYIVPPQVLAVSVAAGCLYRFSSKY